MNKLCMHYKSVKTAAAAPSARYSIYHYNIIIAPGCVDDVSGNGKLPK